MNVVVLPTLGSASQKKDKKVSILTEVDSISGARIDPQRAHTLTFGFRGGEISFPHPQDGLYDPCSNGCIKLRNPSAEVISTVRIDVFPEFDIHGIW